MKLVRKPLLGAAVGIVLSIGAGCVSRPVSTTAPTTKDLVTSTLSQQAVDKVDLLFAIDNSQSMGDKQTILRDAVPNLIQGLLSPPCVNRETRAKTGKLAKYDGTREDNYGCDAGDEPEFKPVTDMHIGVISSSLGDFGSFKNDGSAHVCQSKRSNDRGLLLKKKTGGAEDVAKTPDGFLAWFPSSEENADAKRHPRPDAPVTKLEEELVPSFQDLVVGVEQDGCGLESQLESVYRFLIQPDPWDQVLKFDLEGKADLGTGIDEEILRQRADFLRPDSLVAVIMLTDEDDSSSDPLSVNGFGYAFMADVFPSSTVSRGQGRGTTAPRPTSACKDHPESPDCTSCGFADGCDASTEACQKIKQDPNCQKNGGYYDADDEDPNVRFHHMKQRYGVDPQYPIKRYVDGFTKPTVPDRTGEHEITQGADGKRAISDYIGAAGCTNPLFAASLPRSADEDLCKLKKGTRNPDNVFFAVVGGVPHQLLHFDSSGTPEAAERNRITEKDWTKILGKDPLHFDLTGIDPHMIQSIEPREALAKAGSAESPRGDNGSDPIHGREWNTKKRDLQYACTFDLREPRKCGIDTSCDCNDFNGAPDTNTPLCASDGSATQVKAKAYPTIRELEVVRALGDQGVVASLCPIQLDDPERPDYGYKPAVAAIVERLKNRLTAQCLPRSLRDGNDTEGKEKVSCLVLAQLDKESGQTCAQLNLAVPEDAILKVFKEGLAKDTDVEVCALEQQTVPRGETCAGEGDIGWCYVENDRARKKTPAGPLCPQAVIFSSGTSRLTNARFSLQCIQRLAEGVAAGDNSGN